VGLTTATERVDASGQALADTRSVLRVSDACAPRAEGPGRPCAAAPSRPLAAGKRRCRTRSAYVVARTKSGRARGGPSAAMKSTGRRRTERWSRPRADHSRGRQRPTPGRGGAAPFDEIDPPLLCQHFDLDVNAAQPRSLVLDCLALRIGPCHRSLLDPSGRAAARRADLPLRTGGRAPPQSGAGRSKAERPCSGHARSRPRVLCLFAHVPPPGRQPKPADRLSWRRGEWLHLSCQCGHRAALHIGALALPHELSLEMRRYRVVERRSAAGAPVSRYQAAVLTLVVCRAIGAGMRWSETRAHSGGARTGRRIYGGIQ
jgi:hypothetical protein